MMYDPTSLPDDLPRPQDDGMASHLPGTTMPDIRLCATDGTEMSLSRLPGRTVVYAYPRTGLPGHEPPPEWDMIPGARGCTPQSCSFRDHFAELKSLGADHVFGFSTQDTAYQKEMADRLHLPFPVLSDGGLALTESLRLPTFEYDGETLTRRLTLVIDDGRITHVFYPVFPPNRSAEEVVDWLRENPRKP